MYNFFCTLRGFLFPPLDALWGFCKGTYAFLRSPSSYWWAKKIRNPAYQIDPLGTSLSATIAGGRIGTLAAVGLCAATIVFGVLAVLPGTQPIAAIGFAAIAKYVAITIGWSAVGRTIGAAVGSVIDYCKLKLAEKEPDYRAKIGKITFSAWILTSLFGEAAKEAKLLFKKPIKWLSSCFNSGSAKDKPEEDQIVFKRDNTKLKKIHHPAAPKQSIIKDLGAANPSLSDQEETPKPVVDSRPLPSAKYSASGLKTHSILAQSTCESRTSRSTSRPHVVTRRPSSRV